MLGSLAHFMASSVAKSIMDDQDEGPYSRAHASQAYVFATADDKAVLIHLSSPPKFWEGLCKAVGRPELMIDPRFTDRRNRLENYELLRSELKPEFEALDRDEWIDVLQSQGVPCAPVNSVAEALGSAQLRHLGVIDMVVDPEYGRMPQIRPPVRRDGRPLAAVPRTPLLGEHFTWKSDDMYERVKAQGTRGVTSRSRLAKREREDLHE